MSRTYHHGNRRIVVRGVLREQPDTHRIARAIVELAQMKAEAEAEIEDRSKNARSGRGRLQMQPPSPRDASPEPKPRGDV